MIGGASMKRFLLGFLLLLSSAQAFGEVARVKFVSGYRYMMVEILQDNLVHFEVSVQGPGPDTSTPIYTSPMVQKTDFEGPEVLKKNGNVIETARLRIEIDPIKLCVALTDKEVASKLTTLCPYHFDARATQTPRGLTLSSEMTTHIYGLGEQFIEPGNSDGDWAGRVRTPGGTFGNDMVPFNGGYVGNAQFPVLYAVGDRHVNYALFVDHLYQQKWDFMNQPWKLETQGDPLRWYFIAGDDLPSLREQYMHLVGHPLVPPKKAFGLWVSQYGFSNWGEVDDHLATLRRNGFPVDGFVLDLQWFGGITPNSDFSRMGSLQFDESKFPNPRQKIAQYKADGIGIIPIEESYISRGLPEHSWMESRSYLARDCQNCKATYITRNPWWGRGGLIDWTHPEGSAYWHDLKRQPLIDLGVMGHWTDLGEPEMYNDWAWYWGFPEFQKFHHEDIHNIFNLKWHESIFKGYQRNHVRTRPFLLTRSGASGIQRYGAAMWSGDIGSNLANLATHLNAQMHLSFSGIDYFGADIGGFHRSALTGDLNEMYTQWFANGASFDVPVRPHTENLCKCKQTSPDRIGHLASNLANIRQRYELIPYYYSLAHRAYRFGEPVLPPLIYYYQNDLNIRELGHEKLLGRDLLIAEVARHGEKSRDVYLPEGEWIDYYTHRRYRSSGQWLKNIPEYRDGIFRLPIFARAGAIIPRMYVDEKTMDAFGHRTDGMIRNEMILRVYSDSKPSSFTVFEDDGQTVDYTQGAVRTTQVSQTREGNVLKVRIDGAKGNFEGAPSQQDYVIELVDDSDVVEVKFNGRTIPESPMAPRRRVQMPYPPAQTWSRDRSNHLIRIRTGATNVSQAKLIELTLH